MHNRICLIDCVLMNTANLHVTMCFNSKSKGHIQERNRCKQNSQKSHKKAHFMDTHCLNIDSVVHRLFACATDPTNHLLKAYTYTIENLMGVPEKRDSCE